MTQPTTIDIAHRLGREEVKRRMKERIGDLPSHIPGGFAEEKSTWPAPDRMALDVIAMGQTVSAHLDVLDDRVRIELLLPPSLSFFSGAIEAALRKKGGQLLLGSD